MRGEPCVAVITTSLCVAACGAVQCVNLRLIGRSLKLLLTHLKTNQSVQQRQRKHWMEHGSRQNEQDYHADVQPTGE